MADVITKVDANTVKIEKVVAVNASLDLLKRKAAYYQGLLDEVNAQIAQAVALGVTERNPVIKAVEAEVIPK